MKKILITTMLAFVSCLFVKANAAMVILDYQGPTVVHQTSIERSLLLSSDSGGEFDIVIRPLDSVLRSAGGDCVIPLENVYINNTQEDVYFRYNEFSTLFKRVELGAITKSLVAKVRDFGMVPAGTYNMMFELQAIDYETQTVVSHSTFMLQFVVPKAQELSFVSENAEINIETKDAFAKNRKIPMETNPMVYINSNCDWSLYIDTEKFEDVAGNYFIRTVSASPNVTQRVDEMIQLYPNREILIAKGKAPSSNEYISLELSVEGKDGNFIKAGNYINRLRFILREDRGK